MEGICAFLFLLSRGIVYQQKLSNVPKSLWCLPMPSSFCVSLIASARLLYLLYYVLSILPRSGILLGPCLLTPPKNVILHLASHTSNIFTHITYFFASSWCSTSVFSIPIFYIQYVLLSIQLLDINPYSIHYAYSLFYILKSI